MFFGNEMTSANGKFLYDAISANKPASDYDKHFLWITSWNSEAVFFPFLQLNYVWPVLCIFFIFVLSHVDGICTTDDNVPLTIILSAQIRSGRHCLIYLQLWE